MGLPDPDGLNPAERRGLARRFPELSTRIAVLPADPLRSGFEFNTDLWGWWTEEREAPFGGPVRWNRSLPTADAAVLVQGYGDKWEACLALHRHGGIEGLSDDSYTLSGGTRAFPLVRTVALLWIALDAQALVLRNLEVDGPWRVVLALYDTQESLLGDFADGWAEPHHFLGHDPPRCPDPNVLLCWEGEVFPTEPDEIRDLAFALGGRMEDAWGMKERRFLARTGSAVGEFPVRRWKC